MKNTRTYRPFAITAQTIGHPRKLYTPLTVLNFDAGGKIVAAKVNAMWDTGAECCLMSRSLAEMLHCRFKKKIPAKGIGGDCDSPVGYVNVALLSNGDTVDVITAVVDSTSPDDEYSFIIGLNFINKGTLAISSTQTDTTLSFTIPTHEVIDFTRLSDLITGRNENLPLSSSQENIRILYDSDALELIIPK